MMVILKLAAEDILNFLAGTEVLAGVTETFFAVDLMLSN